jgi:hypothetical protein
MPFVTLAVGECCQEQNGVVHLLAESPTKGF